MRAMRRIVKLDRAHVWHPFTQMGDWMKADPVVIRSGRGAVLTDDLGRKFLDGNSSIWTNLHGHNHPAINAAIRGQLRAVAHSSALGLANEPASLLAEKLVKLARPAAAAASAQSNTPLGDNPELTKVFYSDDGSTAMEVALKLSHEVTRRAGGKSRFLSLNGAYHGDTVGAVSLGHIDLFHKAYGGLLFPTSRVMSPYCYRCPFNRAKPERADARTWRKCAWECVGAVERAFAAAKRKGKPVTGFVFEPLMQGAAGMIPQPEGWLRRVAQIARSHGAHLVADEVMTGFGRANDPLAPGPKRWLACLEEGVVPDFLAVAKGLTGGYLPMAATLTTEKVFAAFLGEYADFKTFFHGHSFTGNQLGAAASLASLEVLGSADCARRRASLAAVLDESIADLWKSPWVGDVRRVGLAVGVELVRNWRTREPFPAEERVGILVCEAMARLGVLTRPIGSVVVLMPPYCATAAQACRMVEVLGRAIGEVFAGQTLPRLPRLSPSGQKGTSQS